MAIGGDFSADFSADLSADVSATASFEASASVALGASASIGFSVGAGSAGGRRDPYLGYNFAVEIEGLVAGGFSEVTGLAVEVETQDYREGGVNGFIHKRAGPARYAS